MIVVFLLVVILVLLYTSQPRCDYTLSVAVLIAAFFWLAIEIHLLSILTDVFALALANWREIIMAFSAAILLSVPVLMIYLALRDRTEHRFVRKEVRGMQGTVRSHFARRVDTLMALGFSRTQAEISAVRQLKRDLSQSGKSASKHHL